MSARSYFQRCRNAVGWTLVDVESESDPDKVYRVLLGDYDYICDCRGFEFSGHCKHRKTAEALRCRWEEGDSPCQSEVERKNHICPLCGGHTDVIAEVEDE